MDHVHANVSQNRVTECVGCVAQIKRTKGPKIKKLSPIPPKPTDILSIKPCPFPDTDEQHVDDTRFVELFLRPSLVNDSQTKLRRGKTPHLLLNKIALRDGPQDLQQNGTTECRTVAAFDGKISMSSETNSWSSRQRNVSGKFNHHPQRSMYDPNLVDVNVLFARILAKSGMD